MPSPCVRCGNPSHTGNDICGTCEEEIFQAEFYAQQEQAAAEAAYWAGAGCEEDDRG